METVGKSISQHAPTLIAVLAASVFVLAVILFRLSVRLKAMQAKWNAILADSSGHTLETVLEEHFRERREHMQDTETIRERVSVLEEKMEGSKRHLGIVRYDAFEEVGGAQSFAFALYDDRGDGVILTSLVGRADCRVYGKPLSRGRSERTLSQEEQRAIDEAQRPSPRPFIAP